MIPASLRRSFRHPLRLCVPAALTVCMQFGGCLTVGALREIEILYARNVLDTALLLPFSFLLGNLFG